MEYIKIGLPMFISVIGWIVVHNLNKKNMEEEKRLVLKSEAYKDLKEKNKKLIKTYSKFIAFLNQTVKKLENYKGNNNVSEINSIKISEAEKFNDLMSKCGDDFIEYISTWEINKIIFKELEKESYALQEEHGTLSELRSKIFSEYLDFIKNNHDRNKVDIKKLRGRIIILLRESANFISCIYDVNKKMQNLVYGDLFEWKIEKRKVSNKNDVTIDSLIKKHEEIIKNYIN